MLLDLILLCHIASQ